jgi:hypothetical protein
LATKKLLNSKGLNASFYDSFPYCHIPMEEFVKMTTGDTEHFLSGVVHLVSIN